MRPFFRIFRPQDTGFKRSPPDDWNQVCCKCERRKTGRTAALEDRVWTALRLPGSRRNNGKSGTGMSCREGSQWTQRQLRPSPGLRRPDPARLTRVGPPTQPIQVIGSSASCARSPMKIPTVGQHLKRAGWELKDRQRPRFFQAVQSLTKAPLRGNPIFSHQQDAVDKFFHLHPARPPRPIALLSEDTQHA